MYLGTKKLGVDINFYKCCDEAQRLPKLFIIRGYAEVTWLKHILTLRVFKNV